MFIRNKKKFLQTDLNKYKIMANINIENLSEFDLNGNDLFEDSESFITELDDANEQYSIIGGYCNDNSCYIVTCGPTNGGASVSNY